MARRGLAKLAELLVVWIGFGLAIAATLAVIGLASGRRLSRTPGCQMLEDDTLTIQLVAVVAIPAATTLALLYWALGAERTVVRVAGIIVALAVGAGALMVMSENVSLAIGCTGVPPS